MNEILPNTTKMSLADLICIIDTREQLPWDMAPMQVVREGLHVGDYSIRGLESIVAIERKSLADFVMCCGSERERFQRELDSLRGWPVSAVVIESTWGALQFGQWRSKLTAKQVMASFCSWVAQGHRLVLAGDADKDAEIAKGILFYAARYRLREASNLLVAFHDTKTTRDQP